MSKKEGFNFGAKVGGIIAGALARGEGGKFINASELGALQQDLIDRIMERIKEEMDYPKPEPTKPTRERKPRASGKKSKPSRKRKAKKVKQKRDKAAEQAANRARVAGVTGININALGTFRAGGALTPQDQQAFLQMGLIELDPDGFPRMTGPGSSLIRAANRGDERAALDARSKAKEKVTRKREKMGDKDRQIEEAQNKANQLQADLSRFRAELGVITTEAGKERKMGQIKRKEAQIARVEARIKRIGRDKEKIRASLGQRLFTTIKSFFQKAHPGREVVKRLEADIRLAWLEFVDRIEMGANPIGATGLFEGEMLAILDDRLEEGWQAGLSVGGGEGDYFGVLTKIKTEAEEYLTTYTLELALTLERLPLAERGDYLKGLKGRTYMYSGEAWKAYVRGKIFGAAPDSIWTWGGPKTLSTTSCLICREEVDAGPRPLRQIKRLPGYDTYCMSNCRHELVRVK